MRYIESSLTDLYQSSVEAFPGTTKRQHATDPITVVNLRWTPFIGMKTLLIRGTAHNEDREYNPLILFKKVAYHESEGRGIVGLAVSGDKKYFLEPISFSENDALVRCQCGDFHWRFQHFDHLDKSLYGRNRKKYEALHNPGSANPLEKEGICKHLMKMMKILDESGIMS